MAGDRAYVPAVRERGFLMAPKNTPPREWFAPRETLIAGDTFLRAQLDPAKVVHVLESTPTTRRADELAIAVGGLLVALKLGAHVDQGAAIAYGDELLRAIAAESEGES
jgi:hypothetical protein